MGRQGIPNEKKSRVPEILKKHQGVFKNLNYKDGLFLFTQANQYHQLLSLCT